MTTARSPWDAILPSRSADFLDVEVADVQGVFLDELAARLHVIAHQGREDLFAFDGILEPHSSRVRDSAFIVVSQSCSAFISPRPL